jgi:hypothetical protein
MTIESNALRSNPMILGFGRWKSGTARCRVRQRRSLYQLAEIDQPLAARLRLRPVLAAITVVAITIATTAEKTGRSGANR